ncbi:MAG: hypothetical protein H7Y59_08720 [Anaerolineales bacterium]|nr:hypothetical protein [Anaerolineales bacterium]
MNKSTSTILIGALIGAVTGIVAATLLTRRAEGDNRETAITTGEGLKLGVLVIGLLRAIASLDDKKA